VSRNSITTESADAQCVGVPARGPIIDRACVLSDSETEQVNMMKLMVVGLAGWINQHQEDVID